MICPKCREFMRSRQGWFYCDTCKWAYLEGDVPAAWLGNGFSLEGALPNPARYEYWANV